MAASNTKECFRESVGKRIVGVLFNALPFGRHDLAHGCKTLVFDDGTGLTLADNGSYWQENKADIQRAVDVQRDELSRAKADIEDVLRVAGALASWGSTRRGEMSDSMRPTRSDRQQAKRIAELRRNLADRLVKASGRLDGYGPPHCCGAGWPGDLLEHDPECVFALLRIAAGLARECDL
jgi:hypothetical protein